MYKFETGDRVFLARPDMEDRSLGLETNDFGTVTSNSTFPSVEFDKRLGFHRFLLQSQLEHMSEYKSEVQNELQKALVDFFIEGGIEFSNENDAQHLIEKLRDYIRNIEGQIG